MKLKKLKKKKILFQEMIIYKKIEIDNSFPEYLILINKYFKNKTKI